MFWPKVAFPGSFLFDTPTLSLLQSLLQLEDVHGLTVHQCDELFTFVYNFVAVLLHRLKKSDEALVM